MKLNCYFLVLSVCLLAGCRTEKETIRFSSEMSPPHRRPAEAPALPAPSLNPQDFFKIKLAIYGYLLERHFWDDQEYTAVFLPGDDDEVDLLIKQFPHHVPPIKTDRHAQVLPNRTPLDKDTGSPAMILSVDVADPVEDTVAAIGKWYAGGAVSGYFTFSLRKSGDDWVIASAR